ncbi:PFL_4669 family integrating conjugative element protein [Citrobacter amalonaticus]|uniref:PFL_4669 family integrating conjugative element protein n=1 Tax=Citrobacter amalonaticus TaxID=35703 RepID=UPI00300C12DC
MSDPSHEQSYTLTSGPLRSAITIELHTHRAVQLWQGRQASASPEGHPLHPIIGIPRFLNLLNIIRMDSSLDNPCADLYMLKLEERLLKARREMDRMTGSVNGIFKLLPDTLTVENCLSIQPVRFPVFSASQLGFIGIYLLTDFDKLARNTQLATHMALLNRTECNDLIQRSSGIIRSIFSLAQKYRRIPVTRSDFKEDNARAKAATALVGELPGDILDGSRRSQFAPPLRRASATENPPPPAPADETDDAAPDSPQPGTDTLPVPETEAE